MTSLLRNPTVLSLLTLTNLAAIAGSTYTLRNQAAASLEESEARFDEMEGTLRGHIGLIHEALERLEGKGGGKYGSRMDKLYESRGKDEKKTEK